MANGQNPSTTTTFVFATIFLLISLALIAVSFSTNNWQETYVQRQELEDLGVDPGLMQTEPVFHNSFRGLFRTCYPEDATFLDSQPNLVEGKCLKERGYEIPNRNPDTLSYGDAYGIRIHLMRAHFSAFVLAMFFLLVCCITAVIGCWNNNAVTIRTTGVLTFIGMFFAAAGMALFHGINYLEVNVLRDMVNSAKWIDVQAETSVDYAQLVRYSYTSFGFSYILGWLGLAMAALSGILYLVVAYKYVVKEEEKYGRKRRGKDRPYENMDPNSPYGYTDDYYKTYAASQYGSAYPEVAYIDNAAYDYGGYR